MEQFQVEFPHNYTQRMEKRGFIEQENSSCLWIKPNNHCISFYRSDLQVPLHTFSDKGTVHCLQPPTKPTNRDLDFCYRHNKNMIHGEEKWEEKSHSHVLRGKVHYCLSPSLFHARRSIWMIWYIIHRTSPFRTQPPTITWQSLTLIYIYT